MLKKSSINFKSEAINVLIIFFASILVAMGLWMFVYKAGFAPSGVDGIVTLLQYVTGMNPGIFTFLINLPLLVAAWFVLNKRYVIYTILYTIVVSITLYILEFVVHMPQYVCILDNGDMHPVNSRLVAAIFGGVVQGLTGIMLRLGGSSGGVDIIGCMIQKKMPHKDLEKIIAIVSYIIVAVSFFVYDQDWNSVLLSIVEIFVCEKITATILKSNRSAIKFEIVTTKEHVEEIRKIVLFELKHSATLLQGKGAFANGEKEVIICLVSYRQIPEFLKRLKTFSETFIYYSDVIGVRGNFDFHEDDARVEDLLLLDQKMKEENYVKDDNAVNLIAKKHVAREK